MLPQPGLRGGLQSLHLSHAPTRSQRAETEARGMPCLPREGHEGPVEENRRTPVVSGLCRGVVSGRGRTGRGREI